MAAIEQCFEDQLGSNESCRLIVAEMALPTHFRSLLSPSYSHYAILVTPLILLAVSLLILSLVASYKLSKVPMHQLGQIGLHGRKFFSWNETTTGDCGGRICDWWIFGGSVWIRFFLGFYYLLSSHGVSHHGTIEHESDIGGENLFACFGVAQDASDTDHRGNHITKGIRPKQSKGSLGILGYDSSLGAHGPLVLAPLRASVLLLVWCSICSFLLMTRMELVRWMTSVDSTPQHGIPELFVVGVIHGIQSVISAGGSISDRYYASQPSVNIALSTIIYAFLFIALAEMILYALGKVCMIFRIYVPRGVSNPGGPRPHKIVRMPKWKEGVQHILPNEFTKWRCAVAQDAHLDTDSRFGHAGSSKLTGEPFGRQIWTAVQSQPSPGQEGTEDELENKVKKEYLATKVHYGDSILKESTNIFSPILDILNNDKKGQPSKNKVQPDFLGSFVQSLIPGSNSKQDNAVDLDVGNSLIQTLASGGRFPPLAFDPSKNPNSCDQLFRAQMIATYLGKNDGILPDEISFMQQNATDGDHATHRPKTASEAAKRGVAFYSMLQTSDGHFAGDYGGPHFLLPGIIVAWYVMGRPTVMISQSEQTLMLHYLRVHQQEDGGWGTHIESPSTMFGAVICYLAVRLLGADKDAEWVMKGRDFIQREGGAVMTSSWAKFWLCIIGCMDWKGEFQITFSLF